ncbi:MAG: PEP/pyruvate-binding domain-containing protein [Candidatus Omnitrophota bacterium]
MERINISQVHMEFKQNRYIKWLKNATINDFASMGAKATNLSILMQTGFPIPDAFCINTDAFKDFITSLDIMNGDKENNQLSKKILSAPIPPEIRTVILGAYQLLKQKSGDKILVAVRSSALDEDCAQASYAGQYNSILNVKSEDELINALRQCWSSYFSSRVQAYRVQISKQNDLAMAVIVQLMISSELSGVVFTVNPLDKNDQCLSIEMARGLGDKLVSGEKTGDHLLVNKRTLKIVSINKERKHLNLNFSQNIKNFDLNPLFKLAVKIEKRMKSPQDIEWAYVKEKFWVLQSRPITYSAQLNNREIWTRANAGEILPDVVTPLTWSVFKPVLKLAGFFMSRSMLTLHWNWKHAHDKFPDSPQLFNGKAYMELTSVYAGFASFPGITADILHKMLGFEFNLLSKKELPLRSPRWQIMDIYRGICYWLEILNITNSLACRSRRFINKESSDIKNYKKDAKELLEAIRVLLSDTALVLGLHVQSTAMTFSAFGLIDALVKKIVDYQTTQLFESALISDFNSISTVQQNIAIWELAQKIKNNAIIKKAVFEKPTMKEVLNSLQMNPAARDIVKLWEEFIAQFGERSTQEFELAVAHWNENADFILQTIRDIIASDTQNPREKLQQQQLICNDVIQKTRLQIKEKCSYLDSWCFSRLLEFYKKGIPLRENLKYCVVTKFNLLRRIFLELGVILKNKSLLLDPNDIFFLEHEEVRQVFDNLSDSVMDINSLVILRKKQYNQNKNSFHADLFFLQNGQVVPVATHLGEAENILCGIGCSHGQFTGPAYVLNSVLENVEVSSGHILVAPSIDPGLTPLFLTACGLVTEVGGMLSHGATVAREYGLPAVVGVSGATKLIKTGQIITVDGVTGRVYLEVDKRGVSHK